MTLDEVRQAVHANLPDNAEQKITPAMLRFVLLLIIRAIAEGVDE